MTKSTLILLLFCTLGSVGSANPTLTIDAGNSVATVSPILYGLMTEEINHSYDGGLYAELVQNRAFLDNPNAPVHWSLVPGNGSAATMALDPSQPLNAELPISLRVDVSQASKRHPAGIANSGYWGIPVQPRTRYHASFYAKAAPGFKGRSPSPSSPTMAARFTQGRSAGLDAGLEAIRGHPQNRQGGADRPSAICPHRESAGQGLVRSGLPVSADVEGPAKRFSEGPDANAGGLETQVPAVSRRELCGR